MFEYLSKTLTIMFIYKYVFMLSKYVFNLLSIVSEHLINTLINTPNGWSDILHRQVRFLKVEIETIVLFICKGKLFNSNVKLINKIPVQEPCLFFFFRMTLSWICWVPSAFPKGSLFVGCRVSASMSRDSLCARVNL